MSRITNVNLIESKEDSSGKYNGIQKQTVVLSLKRQETIRINCKLSLFLKNNFKKVKKLWVKQNQGYKSLKKKQVTKRLSEH